MGVLRDCTNMYFYWYFYVAVKLGMVLRKQNIAFIKIIIRNSQEYHQLKFHTIHNFFFDLVHENQVTVLVSAS